MKLSTLLNKLNAIVQDNPDSIDYDVILLGTLEDGDEVTNIDVGYGDSVASHLCIKDDEVRYFIDDGEYDSEEEMVSEMNLRKIVVIK